MTEDEELFREGLLTAIIGCERRSSHEAYIQGRQLGNSLMAGGINRKVNLLRNRFDAVFKEIKDATNL